MANLIFWSVATSSVVLALLGLVVAASLAVGFAPLVRFIPGLAPYVMVARLISLISISVLSFLLGVRGADQRSALRQAQLDLAFAQIQLDAQKHTAETAERLRMVAETKAAQANQKVTEYEERLAQQPASDGCNLDDADVRSLRDIAR